VELLGNGMGCLEAVTFTDATGISLGSRYLFDGHQNLVSTRSPSPLPESVRAHLPKLRERPRASAANGVAYLPTLPRIRLLIVGGGHVGQAVADLAAATDFDVWVMDDREFYASAVRFPTAKRRIVGDIGEQLRTLVSAGEIGPSTYAIIVTRGHNHDEEALFHLAPTDAGFVGMIGSKRKIRLIFEDLIAKNIPEALLQRVEAPLGIDIGSKTVPEIAVSIVASLIAHRNLGPAACTSKPLCAISAG
jgi:xanthine dehydrogenase accessory factor